MKAKVTILHILPHAGGGVGSVVRALLSAETASDSPYRHKAVSLEYLNARTKSHFNDHGIPWIDEAAFKHHKELSALLAEADIVLVHWWNHPFIMKFLYSDLPPMRLVMWSHVNGYYPPQAFFPTLFDLPDFFVFTSRTSLEAPAILKLTDGIRARLRVIRSSCGIPEGSETLPKKESTFQTGYVGTVEPVKMHDDFLSLCANANLPTPCIVVGGPAHEELRQKAAIMNIANHFTILGPVPDPQTIYIKLHAFAYPMSPRHYGTGEQVLIEAMAYGAVPVVLSNPPEKALIRHGETGLIAETAADFSAALRMLMENPDKRQKLAEGGQRFVMEECGIEHSVKAFHNLFAETLSRPKAPRKLQLPSINGILSGSPLHLFLASLGKTEERRIFENALQQGRLDQMAGDFISGTRGTPFHYLSMLRGDSELEALCNTVRTNRK